MRGLLLSDGIGKSGLDLGATGTYDKRSGCGAFGAQQTKLCLTGRF
jgi:hypothetical protein